MLAGHFVDVDVDGRPTLIASVQRALHLMDEIGEADGPARAHSLARRCGIPLPTTYLRRRLAHEGYLQSAGVRARPACRIAVGA